jgi:ribosome-associated toxin RatA of RatAB toxin-antitoxin module
MAEQTTSSIAISASPAEVMEVIANLPAYPDWAEGVKAVEVRTTTSDGRPERVWFMIDNGPIKDSYVLHYTWQGDRTVSWRLVERGTVLKALDGAYDLADKGDGSTEVIYRLTVAVSLPMLGMLKRKAEKIIIDTALKGLKRRVEQDGRAGRGGH